MVQSNLADHARCDADYVRYRCEPETRLPAQEKSCTQLEQCINAELEPSILHVMVKVLASLVNSFTEELSFKSVALICVLTAVAALLFVKMQRL